MRVRPRKRRTELTTRCTASCSGSAALLGTLLVTDDIIVQLGSAVRPPVLPLTSTPPHPLPARPPQIAYMPLVALAAAWCPVGSEATVFAAVLSCMDLATTLADYLVRYAAA